jgi:hypothetical protein
MGRAVPVLYFLLFSLAGAARSEPHGFGNLNQTAVMNDKDDRAVANCPDAFSQFAQNLAFVRRQGFFQVFGRSPIEIRENLVQVVPLFFSSLQSLLLPLPY